MTRTRVHPTLGTNQIISIFQFGKEKKMFKKLFLFTLLLVTLVSNVTAQTELSEHFTLSSEPPDTFKTLHSNCSNLTSPMQTFNFFEKYVAFTISLDSTQINISFSHYFGPSLKLEEQKTIKKITFLGITTLNLCNKKGQKIVTQSLTDTGISKIMYEKILISIRSFLKSGYKLDPIKIRK